MCHCCPFPFLHRKSCTPNLLTTTPISIRVYPISGLSMPYYLYISITFVLSIISSHQCLIFLCQQYKHTTDFIRGFCNLLQRDPNPIHTVFFPNCVPCQIWQIISEVLNALHEWRELLLLFRNNTRGAEEPSVWERLRLPTERAVFCLSLLLKPFLADLH